MAGDPRWELRQALRTKLLASAALEAFVSTRIYDDVVENPDFPFVVIDTLNMTGELDDKTNNFSSIVPTIYAWSKYQGFMEVEQISAEIYNAIHKADWTGSPNDVPGYQVLYSRFLNAEEGRDPDGITRFGFVRFTILTDAE